MAENKKQTKKEKPNYTYAFNKIFTGSYLIYNLGNEMINFIKTDDNGSKFGNKRLVYINPYGERGKDAAKETKYVLHVMETTYGNNNYYELIAISKVAQVFDKKTNTYINEPTYYNAKKDVGTVNERSEYKNEKVNFLGKFIGDIFNDSKAHLCSFIAESLYIPKQNTHFYFEKNNSKEVTQDLEKVHIKDNGNDIFIINLGCNLTGSRNLCYSRDNDLTILDQIVESEYKEEVKENTIELPKTDEQCLAVICDRTNLEDSTSNQIAYFLSRDKELLTNFIDMLNKHTNNIIDSNKEFKISREDNHIDILLKSDTDLIVIENKIDSHINGTKKSNKKKKDSQLSSYYDYAESFGLNTHYYLLKPKYNSITKEELRKNYKSGDKYSIIDYEDLYKVITKPNSYINNKDPRKVFLYEQFVEGIKYVKSTKSEQMREIAYIRLKQRLDELGNKPSNN